VQQNRIPFSLLTHDEFAKLSTEDKVLYLARAMEALAEERGAVFATERTQPPRTLQ
jgi:hypothetical protein